MTGPNLTDFFLARQSLSYVPMVEAAHWIDTKTRAVVLDFAFFNPDLALFLSTEVPLAPFIEKLFLI